MEGVSHQTTGTDLSVFTKENMQNLSSVLAYFHGKSDSICRVFNKPIIVGIEQLVALNAMINDKLSLHKVLSITSSVDISFLNKKTLTFKTWEEFIHFDFNIESHQVESLYIQWDFFAQLNYQIPQRHTINIRITTSPKPSDLLKAILNGGLDEDDEFEVKTSVMLCRVDFVNNTLAEELLNVVDRWNSNCESVDSNISKASKYAYNHRLFFANTLEIIVAISLVLVIAIFYETVIAKYLANSSHWFPVLLIIPLYMAIKRICNVCGKYLFDKLDGIYSTHIFNLTLGDKKTIEKNKKHSSIKKQVFVFVLNIVVSALLGYVFYLLQSGT